MNFEERYAKEAMLPSNQNSSAGMTSTGQPDSYSGIGQTALSIAKTIWPDPGAVAHDVAWVGKRLIDPHARAQSKATGSLFSHAVRTKFQELKQKITGQPSTDPTDTTKQAGAVKDIMDRVKTFKLTREFHKMLDSDRVDHHLSYHQYHDKMAEYHSGRSDTMRMMLHALASDAHRIAGILHEQPGAPRGIKDLTSEHANDATNTAMSLEDDE